jgi:hypothetical protein
MKTNFTIPMRGDLTVRTRDAKSGRILRTFEIRNTITYIGMGNCVQLLSQRVADPAPATLALGSLKVGNGTTPPVRGDTALVDGTPFTITLTDANKLPNTLGPFELRIVATLGALDANGKTLSEAGLFAVSGGLFARQIHPAIPKTSAIAIDYDWRISFTA